MAFGGISGDGVGPFHLCNGNVNAHVYKDILEANSAHIVGKLLAQDNAPCHKALLVRRWLDKKGVQTLPWPAYSPDLNPIENVWAAMKSQVQGKRFANKDALWNELVSIWNGFSVQCIRKYIDSMPDRVRAVIDANGGFTKY